MAQKPSLKLKSHALIGLAVAALAADVTTNGVAPAEFRLIPAGQFSPRDGRKLDCGSWNLTDQGGQRIVAEVNAALSAYVIDYEHATLRAKKTGEKAPAAGWYQKLEWRPGDGIWAVGVDWTALAAQYIADKEYRYISPVFTFDPVTGEVKKLLHASLTNDPGLDGLTDLAALAADFFTAQPEETPMDELLEQLRWLLNLPVGATAEEVQAHLQKLIDQLKTSRTAEASFDLAAHLAKQDTRIATLSAQSGTDPDPAKFVPVATFQEVSDALAALSAQVNQEKVDSLVNAGLASGKLVPAAESWARDLGKNNLAALSAYLDVATPVVTPNATQTNGVPPVPVKQVQLTAEQLAVCSATGVAPEDFLATLQAEAGTATA